MVFCFYVSRNLVGDIHVLEGAVEDHEALGVAGPAGEFLVESDKERLDDLLSLHGRLHAPHRGNQN